MAHNIFALSNKNDRRANRITVAKFGGSSLMDASRIRIVADIVADSVNVGKKPLIVVSAMGKTTNALLEAGRRACDEGVADISGVESATREIQKELDVSGEKEVNRLINKLQYELKRVACRRVLSVHTKDYLMSFGERISCRVFAAYLNSRGIKAEPIDAYDAGMLTSVGSGSSESEQSGVDVLLEAYEQLRDTFEPLVERYTHTPIVTGFIAKNRKGLITTLGRSGSDFTAAIIGAAVNAREIEIWTDVDGVLSADPNMVPNASTISSLTFHEAAELAFFGAKVIHPGTVVPAMAMDIPVRIRNSYNPSHPGTVVVSSLDRPATHLFTALTVKRKVYLIDINSTRMLGAHGFLAKVFSVFSSLNLSVDVIATSEVSVSLTMERHTSHEGVMNAIEQLRSYADISVKEDMAILTVIGNAEKKASLLEMTSSVLRKADIPLEMVSCGAAKVNISMVIADRHSETAVRLLHQQYLECGAPTTTSS